MYAENQSGGYPETPSETGKPTQPDTTQEPFDPGPKQELPPIAA